MPVQIIDLAKDSTMIKAAQILARALKKFAPHSGIKKSIVIGRREGRGTNKLISVNFGQPYTLGSGKQGSEYAARAFDIGSGIHGKFGRTYTISPRNSPNLVFFWKRMGRFFIGRDGQSVQHPGVKGTGYSSKAMKEARPKIKALFAKNAVEATRLYLRTEFRNFGK